MSSNSEKLTAPVLPQESLNIEEEENFIRKLMGDPAILQLFKDSFITNPPTIYRVLSSAFYVFGNTLSAYDFNPELINQYFTSYRSALVQAEQIYNQLPIKNDFLVQYIDKPKDRARIFVDLVSKLMSILMTAYKEIPSILSKKKINDKQVLKIDSVEGALVSACDFSLRDMLKMNFETEEDERQQLDRILNEVLFITDISSD